MAVEEKVVLKVEVDADISNDIAAIRTRLKAIENHMGAFNKKAKDMDRGMDRVNKRFDKMRGVVTKLTGVFVKFASTLAKFSFIALAGQIGLFTAGLLAAKAALITGRAAVSAYQASLKGLSVAAAGVATAIAVAAAAMRQFNEVQLGSQFGGGAQGRANAIRATRGIGSRTRGLLGGEATTAIAGSLGRAGARPGQTQNLMRELLNIAGGDAKAAQNLAAAIGSGDVKKATTALQSGVGFNQGSLKNVGSIQGVLGTVGSGGATGANFKSVGADMASTFIGTLKTEFAGISGIFADLGAPMLEPFRQSFANISRMLKEDILSMTAVINKFGAESFAPTLESFIGATSEFIRKNIVNNLSDIKEMGQSFVDFGMAVKEFFLDIGDYLGKLEPAADVVIEMFKAMGGAAGGRGLFQEFNQLVTDNASAFTAFGESIGNVIGALFDQLSGGQMGFFNKLPLLADVFNTLANDVIPSLFGVFNKFAPLMERLPGALESLANILDMLAPIIETLVSAINVLMGGLQSLSGGPLGAVGDFGSVAVMGGLMMLTKGKGRALLGKGARGGAAAVRGGVSAARGIGTAKPGGVSASNLRAVNAGVKNFGQGGIRGLNNSLTARMGVGRAGLGRGPGLLGKAGKFGALALGLEGLNIGRDFMDGGLSGVGSGYADRAEASPIFAGLGTGSAAAFLGGPVAGFAVGGATTALGAYKRGMSGDDSMANRLTGAAGGAMAGAAIGSVIPGFGTLVGGIIGGAIGGGLAWWAGSQGQQKLKDASEKAAKQVKLDIKDFKAGSGSAATSLLAGQADLLDKAMKAAIDEETGLTNMEGDTREFRDYLRSVGVDPESVHRDDLFEELFNDNTLFEIETKIQEANTLMTDQMQSIADQTGLTMEEVERTLNDFNIDPFVDYMEDSVAGIINLRNQTVADLTQSFMPDFFQSQAKRDELLVSNNAQMEAIVGTARSGGDISTDQAMDYLSSSSQLHIAEGMNPTQASIAAIQAFSTALELNLGGDARGQIRNLGLNRMGETSQELTQRIYNASGMAEQGIGIEALRDSIYGAGRFALPNGMDMISDALTPQTGLGFNTFMQQVQSLQGFGVSAGNYDRGTVQTLFDANPELAEMTISDQAAQKLIDVAFATYEGFGTGPGATRLEQTALGQITDDGITAQEALDISESYGLDTTVLGAALDGLPEGFAAQFQDAMSVVVAQIIAGGRPMVNINGDFNGPAERGGDATYTIAITASSNSGSISGFGTDLGGL